MDKNAGLSHGISGGCGVVPVELDEVVEGDEDAHQVHQDPKEVQDVVPIRALHQVKNFEKMSELNLDEWTGGFPGPMVDICCHCARQESWTKV